MKDAFAALIARLNALPVQLENGAAAAVQNAAARAADLARADVPVDSGALKGSIAAVSTGKCTASVIAASEYAGCVEYGTSRMAAQPYMLPSARAVSGDFFRAAAEAAKEATK